MEKNKIIKSVHLGTKKVIFSHQTGMLDDMFFIDAKLKTASVSEWYTAANYEKAEKRFEELVLQMKNES
jgi:hypothetical protein